MSGRLAVAIAAPQAHSVRGDVLWVVLGLLALAAWDAGGLDILLARGWGSAAGFAWRDHWFTAGLMHGGIRVLGWIAFAVLLVGVWRPMAFVRLLSRRERIWWLGTTLLCVALIPLLKRVSATSCPWSLAEFGGGVALYVPHWVLGLADGGPGGCFPSGHASTAFAFISGWFVLRERAPRAARLWLLGVIAAGVALGAVQMVRGAHCASHSMWTAWICWTVSAASFHALARWRAARHATLFRLPTEFTVVGPAMPSPEPVRIDTTYR